MYKIDLFIVKTTDFWATYGPMQKFNKFTKVFRIFLVLQTCFTS